MPVRWTLRNWLKNERGVSRAVEVRRLILERTGYRLSNQAVCDLLNGRPKLVRLDTVQAICDAFYCRLVDFCEVLPVSAQKPPSERRTPSIRRYSTGGSKEKSVSSEQSRAMDFAALFPDARKFSSDQRTTD
jgi:DNA-binding Xre family transcriptional regulator